MVWRMRNNSGILEYVTEKMYQIPFILLDECTCNLDQEMTEIVINGIRQYPGKIILIAHPK